MHSVQGFKDSTAELCERCATHSDISKVRRVCLSLGWAGVRRPPFIHGLTGLGRRNMSINATSLRPLAFDAIASAEPKAVTPTGSEQPKRTLIAQSNNSTAAGNTDLGKGEVQGFGPDGRTVFAAKLVMRVYDGSGKTRYYANGRTLPVNIIDEKAARTYARQQIRQGALGELPRGDQNAFKRVVKSSPTGEPAASPKMQQRLEARAPAISSTPTLAYVDWNGSLNDLAALGSRVVPGGKNIKQLLHNSMPMLDKLTKELGALNMGDAVRVEVGFATDGKNPLADLKSPPQYGAILRLNTATLGAYKNLKQPVLAKALLASGINPPLANKLSQNIVDAANKRGGFGNLSEIRLNFNPRRDGGVDVMLGYAVAATVKKGNTYGAFFLNVRGPVNNTDSGKPGNQANGQIVLALVGGHGVKTGAAEAALVRVINYKNTPSSQGFVRDKRTGDMGVLVVHQGKPSFYGLGSKGRAIAESITGRKAQDVPQADLPAVTAQQLADDFNATLPKGALEQAKKLTGMANAAEPLTEAASNVTQIVVAPAIAPNPWTIGNALLRAHGVIEESGKAFRDRMIQDGTASGKNITQLYRRYEGAPVEEKDNVIKQLSLAIREGIESGRLDPVDTYAAWQRLENRTAFPTDARQLMARHTGYREGFPESFTFPLSEFGQAVAKVILDGETAGPPSTIEHALSSVRVEPLTPYAGPSTHRPSVGR